MPPIHRVAQTDAINEALEIVEAHLNNVGIPCIGNWPGDASNNPVAYEGDPPWLQGQQR